MAKKVEIKAEISEIKKAVEAGNVIIGTQMTLKSLRNGQLKKIFVANNCPGGVKEDIQHYSKIAKVEVVELEEPNDELGAICRKQFSISVLSLPSGV
jgi:large subunit ribosomal protein L30e